MGRSLEEYLEKYLKDERYSEANADELKYQVTRLFNKFNGLSEYDKSKIIERVIRARFGERPKSNFEPQDLNIEAILKEKGIL